MPWVAQFPLAQAFAHDNTLSPAQNVARFLPVGLTYNIRHSKLFVAC